MPDLNTEFQHDRSRRRMLGATVIALAGLGLACSRSGAAGPPAAAKSAPRAAPPLVTIAEFSAEGKRLRTAKVPKIIKPLEEWKRVLPPKSYAVARLGGTERAFSGKYNDHHGKGIFRCVCCGTALFHAATKFDSGTGWPSFWQPIDERNIAAVVDREFGMVRTETKCRRCDAHLGHVFDDGPQPTGLRYCMNSVSLHFEGAGA